MNTTMKQPHEKEIFGHPSRIVCIIFCRNVGTIFLLWDESNTTLFLLHLLLWVIHNLDYGWSNAETLSFYGTYTMFVYLTSIPGGWIADKFIGQKKAVHDRRTFTCVLVMVFLQLMHNGPFLVA